MTGDGKFQLIDVVYGALVFVALSVLGIVLLLGYLGFIWSERQEEKKRCL